MGRFFEAVRFLSIVPLRGESRPERIGSATAFFPLVGLIFGLILYIANLLLLTVLPEQIVNIFLVIILLVLSGGIHLDGLADTSDGFFSGKGREEALKVMQDSRIGTYGVVAIVLVLLLKVSLLTVIPGDVKAAMLITIPVLSRLSIPLAAYLFKSAKEEGLGQTLSDRVGPFEIIVSLLITAIVASLIFGLLDVPILIGVLLFFCILFFIFGVSYVINRRFGGMTGDTYGALIELTETWSLLIAVVFL